MRGGATVLAEILERKRAEVDCLRRRERELAGRAAAAPPPRDFEAGLLLADRVAVIAEFKRRSPSAGPLSPGAEPGAVAAAYERGGAAALSVLTDGPHFGGSLDDLRAARNATSLPVLRKDFLLDPIQLVESRAAGADAVLLIARALPGAALADLLAGCAGLGLAPLVETHDAGDVERALAAGARVLGANARDLATFEVDRARALELVAAIPADRIAIAESGIRGAADVAAAGRAGAEAVLVGSRLMGGDPEEAVAELVGHARRPRAPAARAGGG